jgi:protein LTV1
LDLDPDIVAAMDEDFDFEDPYNELEDNFMELANAEGSGSEMGSGLKSHGNDDDDGDE